MKLKYVKLVGVLVVAGLALCLGAVATQRIAEGEREVSLAEVPEPVKSTILAQAQGNAINEIEVEVENGQTVYEAEVIIEGREVEIEVAADGALLGKEADDEEGDDDDEDEGDDEEEELVSLAEVPEAVRATIVKEAAGAQIKEIEREIENGQTIYSAEVVIGGQEVEFEVAPDGTLLGKEIENEDDDE